MDGCRPLTDNEISAVTATFDGEWAARNRCLFVMGYTTGFRISELLSLCVRDVLHGDRIASEIKVQRRATKGRKRSRTAKVAPLLRPVLADWLDDIEHRDLLEPRVPLFLSRRELRPISRIQGWRILTAAFESAGIFGPVGTLGTHAMRKTYADRMYDHFGDIFKVQQALNHASPASTVAYLSFRDEEQQTAIDTCFPTPDGGEENVSQFADYGT